MYDVGTARAAGRWGNGGLRALAADAVLARREAPTSRWPWMLFVALLVVLPADHRAYLMLEPRVAGVVDLGVLTTVAALALVVWRDRRARDRRNLSLFAWPLALAAYPVLLTFSAALPDWNARRAAEVLVTVLAFMVLAMRLGDGTDDVRRDLAVALARTVSGWAVVSLVVFLIGAVDPFNGRFTLIGSYAATSGAVLAAALVAVLVARHGIDRRELAVHVGLLVPLLLLNGTRTPLIFVVAWLGLVFGRGLRGQPLFSGRTRFMWLIGALAAAAAVATVFVVRTESIDTALRLNNRLPIWRAIVESGPSPVGGGWGAGFEALAGFDAWVADNAHNAWLQWWLTAGLIGASAFTGWLLSLARSTPKGGWERPVLALVAITSVFSNAAAALTPILSLLLIVTTSAATSSGFADRYRAAQS